MEESIKVKFNEFRNMVDEGLDKYVEVIYPESIYESMKYSLYSVVSLGLKKKTNSVSGVVSERECRR